MLFWRKRKSSGWNLIIGDGGKAGLDPDLLQPSSEEKKQLMYDAVYLPMCMCVGVCCFLPQQAPWTIDAGAEGLIQLVLFIGGWTMFNYVQLQLLFYHWIQRCSHQHGCSMMFRIPINFRERHNSHISRFWVIYAIRKSKAYRNIDFLSAYVFLPEVCGYAM